MKKVMIYAYTKFNLGDDLFIRILCNRYPKTNFILYAPKDYKISFKEINNLTVIPSDTIIIRGINYLSRKVNKDNFLRNIIAKRCDVAVYIGGSLFMQQGNWINALINKESMKIKNKPFYLLGANFGPFEDEDFYLNYKKLFKNYTDVCFRDAYSFNLFNDLPNVRIAPDIVFQLNEIKVSKKENNIVISIIKPSYREYLNDYDQIYYNKIKEIAVKYVQKGFTVTLMSFCEPEGDDEAIEKIFELIPTNYLGSVKKHYYRLNMDETLSIIASSSYVIASRFHAMILGWVFNKPVFPIVYSKKMTNVMKDVGFKGNYADFSNIETLDSEDVYKCLKSNIIDVSIQIEEAKMHFKVLDNFLLTNLR